MYKYSILVVFMHISNLFLPMEAYNENRYDRLFYFKETCGNGK